ncbi:hypothetical protein OQA88_11197 [Cercophora sp. LCS_1]
MALPVNSVGLGGKLVTRRLGGPTTTATRNFHNFGARQRPTVLRTILATQSNLSREPRRDYSVASFLEAGVASSQHLITGLHTLTGTPWFVTIPLFALGFHIVTRVPLSIYTSVISRRRPQLYPLIAGWRARHSREILSDPKWATYDSKARDAELVKRVTQTTNRLYKTWKCQMWKRFLPLGGLPVWLIAAESIRRLAGAPLGMIGAMVGWLRGTVETTVPTPGSVSTADILPTVQDVLATADMSLQTGGCLWFTDLTAADPLHILPFVLSATMVANILPRSLAEIRLLAGLDRAAHDPLVDSNLWPLQRFFVIFAVALGPLTINLPAALHIWWISTSGLVLIQKEITRKVWPIKEYPIKPSSNREYYFVKPARTNTPPLPKKN